MFLLYLLEEEDFFLLHDGRDPFLRLHRCTRLPPIPYVPGAYLGIFWGRI